MTPLPELRLEPIERLEDAREDWSALAAETGQPFATWEWNSIWWRWFGSDRELYSFTCHDEAGRPVAILPLYVAATRPLRIARFLGFGGIQSPVCGPDGREVAAEGLRRATEPGPDACRLLLAERMPGGWGELVGGRLLDSLRDPVLRFEGRSWDEFLASRSKNFRDQVRRRERKLVRETGLGFRLADDPGRLADDMEALFRLHEARWGAESTGVFDEAGKGFHQELAAVALERGWLRLWLAEVDGRPVAAWYGLRFAGCEWYYQAGRDPSYDRLSLGFVLLAHTVREACNDGLDAFRFLPGRDEYKSRFAGDDPGAESRLLSSGAAGRLGSAALAGARALPGPMRRRVLRVAG